MRKSTFEEEIAHNGFLLYRNVGDSMLPLIRQGKDLLLIARKPQGRLNKYDVPLYRRDSGQYVLHRILKVRKNDYVLCGDNRWRRETGITDRHIIGVLTAVFLAEVAPRPLAAIVKPAVELLAGIPSVIYGLLGIYLLNPLMYKLERLIFRGSTTHQFTGGANLLSAVIVLAIMILPTVINISETSIRAVPAGIKSSSLALGASHVQTIFRSILPAAKSGIVTAIVLGVGRAIGEAMAITLVSGSSVNVPLPFNSVRFLTTAIVSEMGYSSGLHRQVLFTIGLVLFVFIMIINIVLNKILKKGADDNE